MVVHDRADEHRLLVQGTLSRGWGDTRKCLAHWLFWMVEVGIGGTIAWAHGGGMALIFIGAIFLSVLIVAVVTAPTRQRDDEPCHQEAIVAFRFLHIRAYPGK